jgi:hypothetical protein
MSHDDHHGGPPQKVSPKEQANIWQVGKQLPMTHKEYVKAVRNPPFTIAHFKVMWPWVFSFATVFSYFAYKFQPHRLHPEMYQTSLYLKQLRDRGYSYPLTYEQLVEMHRARDELKKGLPVRPLSMDTFEVEVPNISFHPELLCPSELTSEYASLSDDQQKELKEFLSDAKQELSLEAKEVLIQEMEKRAKPYKDYENQLKAKANSKETAAEFKKFEDMINNNTIPYVTTPQSMTGRWSVQFSTKLFKDPPDPPAQFIKKGSRSPVFEPKGWPEITPEMTKFMDDYEAGKEATFTQLLLAKRYLSEWKALKEGATEVKF